MKKKDVRIVFMGTPEFALPALELLFQNGYHIVAVVTAPDRPAGRGRKIIFSPVKEFALSHHLLLFQPTNLKDETFVKKLSSLKANIQIVVAFRMLPEIVWKLPYLGTFNLHASLLPQYRGAAPINHAIINGEKNTGLTTFFIDEKIDTGRIIKQLEMKIGEDESFGELHDRMKIKGAELIEETVKMIIAGKNETTIQDSLIESKDVLKPAPKIFRDDCKIDWNLGVEKINNLIRGLSPVPGAFSFICIDGENKLMVKIFKSKVEGCDTQEMIGKVITDNNTFLKVAATGGYLKILEMQPEGKRRMKIEDFLRGYKLPKNAFFEV